MTCLISVIVPVRDQVHRLALTLAAFERQRGVRPTDFEVIVVDDGSTDGADELVRRRSREVDYSLVGLASRSGGCRGVPRNLGAAAARAEVLVFLDADACPSEELLGRHLAMHQEKETVALGDCYVVPGLEKLLDPSTGTLFPQFVGAGSQEAPALTVSVEMLREHGDEALAPHATKGIYPDLRDWQRQVEEMLVSGDSAFPWVGSVPHNLSMRRASFARIGGFDASLRHAEGFDLGIRARRAGCALSFAEGARSYHLYHWRDPRAQSAVAAEALVTLAERFPDDAPEAAFLWMAALAGDPYIPVDPDLADWRCASTLARDPAARAGLRTLWEGRQRLGAPGTLMDYLVVGGALNAERRDHADA